MLRRLSASIMLYAIILAVTAEEVTTVRVAVQCSSAEYVMPRRQASVDTHAAASLEMHDIVKYYPRYTVTRNTAISK